MISIGQKLNAYWVSSDSNRYWKDFLSVSGGARIENRSLQKKTPKRNRQILRLKMLNGFTEKEFFQKKFITSWQDTGKTVYEKSRDSIIELFKEIFPKLKNNELVAIKQNSNEGKYHKASELDQISEIKLKENYKARKFLNILRARTFPPHPSAFFYDGGKKYFVRIMITEEQQ